MAMLHAVKTVNRAKWWRSFASISARVESTLPEDFSYLYPLSFSGKWGLKWSESFKHKEQDQDNDHRYICMKEKLSATRVVRSSPIASYKLPINIFIIHRIIYNTVRRLLLSTKTSERMNERASKRRNQPYRLHIPATLVNTKKMDQLRACLENFNYSSGRMRLNKRNEEQCSENLGTREPTD
ncbi:uncharacterized protein LOC130666665 isoform X2 [Microplitis mediator]|uniref:uncharacterized protein LOC130666665 isoform X2 n=1 Tax=Microplitis mediator TaxID=375433 RepID=UPI002552136E|nr:uncharacterized protein LOC130666665 isoform X2 [Microplitis mediator]XP_057323843.1 uncharacterized protein LOC130666665 isoform X2 [Microplitis mediator]XP_057323844.1 uncharacterized protein LOC130666665 isoform X2 [Microplitis mediator]XP_057323845.1 uncharacterized protein LOC130666665 isoform X2 [Microplitis mediator]